jgi:hypothetical protein
MTDFTEIQTRVTIRDILADCGYEPRRNRMPCPIHGGKNPSSFSFNDDTFCCFSCGESGGLLDLTRHLLGFDRQEGLRYLAQKAGVDWKDVSVDNKDNKPSKPKPIIIDENRLKRLRLDILKTELSTLEMARDCYLTLIRIARRSLKDGKIDLSEYYARIQYYEHVLEELDTQVTRKNYELNMKRRGTISCQIRQN